MDSILVSTVGICPMGYGSILVHTGRTRRHIAANALKIIAIDRGKSTFNKRMETTGSKSITPAVLFVDNMDIPQIGKHPDNTMIEVEKRLKKTVTCWSDGL